MLSSLQACGASLTAGSLLSFDPSQSQEAGAISSAWGLAWDMLLYKKTAEVITKTQAHNRAGAPQGWRAGLGQTTVQRALEMPSACKQLPWTTPRLCLVQKQHRRLSPRSCLEGLHDAERNVGAPGSPLQAKVGARRPTHHVELKPDAPTSPVQPLCTCEALAIPEACRLLSCPTANPPCAHGKSSHSVHVASFKPSAVSVPVKRERKSHEAVFLAAEGV